MLKRSQIANLLGALLALLALAVGVAGIVTYRNMSEIVEQLESDDRPGNNLLLYKEVLSALHEMENYVESYQLLADPKYLSGFHRSNTKARTFVDSISNVNPDDKDMQVFNDSLESLIRQKYLLLSELMKVPSGQQDNALAQLRQKMTDFSAPDTLMSQEEAPTEEELEEKEGFLKRLFGKKESEEHPQKPLNTDSLLSEQKRSFTIMLERELDAYHQMSESNLQAQRTFRLRLESAHFDIQSLIIDLVGYLESREAVKLKIKSLNARDLAARTNEQIARFTSLASILLIGCVFIMVSYVRANRRYQTLLRESKIAAETLAKAKERFFANMSHELRTPMNAISGFARLLLRAPMATEQKEQVTIIHKSSEHLLRLLNDILDFSKLQAQKLQLEKAPFSIREVCMEAIALLQGEADKKGIELRAECSELPEFVNGDAFRLRQILLNLLSNGIKYTEQGHVALKTTIHPAGQQLTLQIEVSDTGVGIATDQQFRLFREFEQADQSSFSKGTGLGLAITRRLVMLHGGTIALKSQEGEGTTLSLELHYTPAAKPSDKTVKSNLSTPNLPSLHALIADDEPFNVKLLETVLSHYEITCDQASDGKEALLLAQSTPYDILLIDLKMPRMSGWELAKLVKEQSGPNQNTPIVALTATVTELDLTDGQNAGINRFLRKPFDEQELLQLIYQLTGKQTKDSLSKKQPPADLSSLLSMGDEAFVQDMVETFLVSATAGMQSLRAHFRSGDFEGISSVSHRIVAPARHFRASRLVDLLKDIQEAAESNPKDIHEATIDELEEALVEVSDYLQSTRTPKTV